MRMDSKNMKLIFLYGPPAVGKLTVAKELSKLTGFKVFHNHLTTDLVASIFELGDEVRTNFISRYRLELIDAGAKRGVDMIFTFAYAKGPDDGFVRKIVRRVRKHGGEVCFVRLHCDRAELFRRAKSPWRKPFKKIKTLKTLKETMQKYDLFSDFPYGKSLVIDNTGLSPRQVALKIRNHFGLANKAVSSAVAKAKVGKH